MRSGREARVEANMVCFNDLIAASLQLKTARNDPLFGDLAIVINAAKNEAKRIVHNTIRCPVPRYHLVTFGDLILDREPQAWESVALRLDKSLDGL